MEFPTHHSSTEITINPHEKVFIFIDDDNDIHLDYFVEQYCYNLQLLTTPIKGIRMNTIFTIICDSLTNNWFSTELTTEYAIIIFNYNGELKFYFTLTLSCYSKFNKTNPIIVSKSQQQLEETMNTSLSKLLTTPYPSSDTESNLSEALDYVDIRHNSMQLQIDFADLQQILFELKIIGGEYEINEAMNTLQLFLQINNKFTFDNLKKIFANGKNAMKFTKNQNPHSVWVINELVCGLGKIVFDRTFL